MQTRFVAVGNWQLAIGNWQLATGIKSSAVNGQLTQLAIGNWQLATDN
jgi:hypothetical protein